MHTLIRTNTPRGSLIEHDGVLWRVGAPSPHCPSEAECTALACPDCNHQPCRRNDQNQAVCGRCDWRDQLVAPDPFRTAIAELVTEGLWTEHHD